MEITTQRFQNYSVIKPIGEIDLYNVDELKKEFSRLMQSAIFNIGVDLSDVTYIDSSGIGALLSVIKDIQSNNGRLQLCEISESVKKILTLTRLSSFFNISDSIEQMEMVFENESRINS